ncbi:hypothetical protein ACWKT5_21115 [Streptomyces avermitilis]
MRGSVQGIGSDADGTTGSATDEKSAVLGDHGGRISRRKVISRRAPPGRR